MADETNPTIISRPAHEIALELLQNWNMFEEAGRARFRAAKSLGKLLTEQKERTPHGEWLPWVEANCKFGRKRAADFMRVWEQRAKCNRAVTFEEALEMIREAQIAEAGKAPEVEIVGDAEGPALTDKERKILVFLIGKSRPGLGKKLRDGTKKLTDAELRAACPQVCDKCRRGIFPIPPHKPCEACEAVRANRQAELFEDKQEPNNPEDPASGPAPPDPYKEVKSAVTKTASTITKLAAEDASLYEALKTCRLMDHPPGESPRFVALAGVKKVIELVEGGETSASKIKCAYDIASGAFVPPRFYKKG